jgi:hypothetical protein
LTWLQGEVNPAPNRRYSHDYTSSRGLRQSIVQRVRDLDLQAPFTWEEYLLALQAEFARAHPPLQLEIRRAAMPQGTSGQWVWIERPDTHEQSQELRESQLDTHAPSIVNQASGDNGATARETAAVSAHLFLPQVVDESHLERIVYHELGHLELGHLQLNGSKPLERTPPNVEVGRAFSCDALPVDDRRERDAEAFATILARLARGWDPGALQAPRLDQFFEVLS